MKYEDSWSWQDRYDSRKFYKYTSLAQLLHSTYSCTEEVPATHTQYLPLFYRFKTSLTFLIYSRPLCTNLTRPAHHRLNPKCVVHQLSLCLVVPIASAVLPFWLLLLVIHMKNTINKHYNLLKKKEITKKLKANSNIISRLSIKKSFTFINSSKFAFSSKLKSPFSILLSVKYYHS